MAQEDPTSVPAGSSLTQTDDQLIGQLALEWKLVTEDQLRACRTEQEAARTRGETRSLGQLLLEREWLKSEDLLRLLAAQRRRAVGGIPEIPRYEIQDRLGEGVTSVVYRAWDRQLGRPVALKVLRENVGLSGVARERFDREARATAGISHPHVMVVYDSGEHAGRLYLVMEYVSGRPLSELLRGGGLDERAVLRLVEKAARGVAAAHAKGVIHRDLKPANILVTDAGEPKVGDFGLAHFVEAGTELTRTGLALGTPLYMSPEQVRGESRTVSPRTDIYSLGAILYEALTGRPPHDGDTTMEIYGKIVGDEPVPPRQLRPKLSPDLQTITLKALEKSPDRRYESAEAFAEDLRRVLDGEPIGARPVGGLERLRRRIAKHRAGAVAALLAAALAAAAAWEVVRIRRRAAAPARELIEHQTEAEFGLSYEKAWDRAVDVLPAVDAAKDFVGAPVWRREGGMLVSGVAPFARLQIPYQPPEEYDFRVSFVRRAGMGDVNLILNQAGRPFLWVMGAFGNTVFGFGEIDKMWANANPTTVTAHPCLENGRLYTVVVQVRRNGMRAYLNGKLLAQWRTDYRDVSIDDSWKLPDPTRIGLGTYEGPTEFRRLQVLEKRGKGRFLR
jgi:predicted Ser/Thr protein kinase